MSGVQNRARLSGWMWKLMCLLRPKGSWPEPQDLWCPKWCLVYVGTLDMRPSLDRQKLGCMEGNLNRVSQAYPGWRVCRIWLAKEVGCNMRRNSSLEISSRSCPGFEVFWLRALLACPAPPPASWVLSQLLVPVVVPFLTKQTTPEIISQKKLFLP